MQTIFKDALTPHGILLRLRSAAIAAYALPMIVIVLWPASLCAKTNYKKWLDQEVVWIISSKERAAFTALKGDQEKEEFIRKFWERRDPTPSTPRNEFKEEHYRRFEYAIKHFQEGMPGWKSDRGRIYIIHGPPAREEFFTSNSQMDLEGRGDYRSRTPNTIVWTYRGNPNAKYYRGDITLVFQPVGGISRQDFALGESKTAQDKADELNRRFGDAADQNSMESDIRFRLVLAGPPAQVTTHGADLPSAGLGESERYKEDLFRSPGEVLEENLTRTNAREAARQSLREAIATHLSFGNLPLEVSSFSFLQPDGNYRVHVKVDIPPTSLVQVLDKGGQAKAVPHIDIYCALVDPKGGIADEFVDSVVVSPSALENRTSQGLHYLNSFMISAGNYTLKAAVRSAASERLGFGEMALALRPRGVSGLQLSDVLVTDRAEQVTGNAQGQLQENVIGFGDVRFVPSAQQEFESSSTLLISLQILLPNGRTISDTDLSLGMNFIQGQSIVKRLEPRRITEANSSLSDLVNYATSVKLTDFPPGNYVLQVQVIDHRSKEFSIRRAAFSIR